MIQNNRDEDVCRAWDVLAEQDHTYRMSESEYFHYRQNWWITLSKSGHNTQPVRKRSDFKQAFVYGGLLSPTGCVKTTPQMTHFRGAKVCNNWLQIKIGDHRIRSDCKCKSGQKAKLYTWYCVCVVTMHDNTSYTNDNVTTKTQSTFYTAHMNIDM